MGVGAEEDFSRLPVAQLGDELMADAARSMEMTDMVLVTQLVPVRKAVRIGWKAGRIQMVMEMMRRSGYMAFSNPISISFS